jgi:hypothetical protein
MGIVILFLLIIGAVGFLSWHGTEDDNRNKKIGNMGAGIIITSLFLGAITIISVSVSYGSYIELKEKLAVIEQYKETVELYAEKGVQEFKPGTYSATELTDLKYNNYQTQIGQMIREMRDTIVEYNTLLTGKKIMNDSFMFSWITYLPEEMNTIKMSDYID